jgi:large conductance mechanosensitive channel
MLKEFKQFLLRGNVVDLAVGVVVGASLGTLISALVSDFLTPLISAVAKIPDFSGLSFTVNGSQFMYGHFINAAISFLLVAATVFFVVVKPINLLISISKSKPPLDPKTKKCKECLSDMPLEARRCAHCGELYNKLQEQK